MEFLPRGLGTTKSTSSRPRSSLVERETTTGPELGRDERTGWVGVDSERGEY